MCTRNQKMRRPLSKTTRLLLFPQESELTLLENVMTAERAVVNILTTDFDFHYLGTALRVQSKCGFTHLRM